jgi:hypothetical protein
MWSAERADAIGYSTSMNGLKRTTGAYFIVILMRVSVMVRVGRRSKWRDGSDDMMMHDDDA